MKKILIVTLFSLIMAGILFLGACKKSEEAEDEVVTIHVDLMLNVPGGGGSAELTFAGRSGVRIRITLSCSNANMRPYGYLQAPSGSGDYIPPNNAPGPVHAAETVLGQTGTFTLAVFDGANVGGQVHVVINQI